MRKEYGRLTQLEVRNPHLVRSIEASRIATSCRGKYAITPQPTAVHSHWDTKLIRCSCDVIHLAKNYTSSLRLVPSI